FYDSAVGRFVSADTVIPGGTQGYDRFAYVYNNPLRYNDPTGHCPWCLLTGIAGAVALTAVVYASHPNLTTTDYARTAILGFGAGFLIGTGVGAGAGLGVAATAMAVGAGTGALASAGAYAVTSGDSFNMEEMGANALIGGVTGAASALTGPAVVSANVAKSGASMLLRAGINALGTEASQIIHDEYYDEDHDPKYPIGEELAGGAMAGGVASYIGEGADIVVTTLTGSDLAGTAAYNVTKNFLIGWPVNVFTGWMDCTDEGTCQQ
ncbi:MAG: hypothetical protein LC138_14540, partial [Anaerolineales bacterium]|nr:hypothetical protein [Anaerolineales bacterium]